MVFYLIGVEIITAEFTHFDIYKYIGDPTIDNIQKTINAHYGLLFPFSKFIITHILELSSDTNIKMMDYYHG